MYILICYAIYVNIDKISKVIIFASKKLCSKNILE